MAIELEEIDYCDTPLGELVLRRRTEPRLGEREVYEIKLGDAFLMSSLFTSGEVALAQLGLAATEGDALAIVVGGLGLGYTARAALAEPRVAELLVIEAFAGVIDWHRRDLVPGGAAIASDPRVRFIEADFFALALPPGRGFDPEQPQRRFDAILIDIDHSPRHVLAERHAALYARDGLAYLSGFLAPRGVLALWSNDAPDAAFSAALDAVFASARAEVIVFDNPYTGGRASSTVYVARNRG